MRVLRFLAWPAGALALLLATASPAAAVGPALPRAPDSLVALLRQPALPDTVRVDALARLANIRRQTDLAEGRKLGEQGLALARRIHYLGGELNCLLSLFNIVASSRQYVEAEQLAQRALKLSETAPPRLLHYRVMALQSMAAVSNSTNNDFQRAGQYYRQALALARLVRPAKPRLLNGVVVGLSSLYVNRLQTGETADSVQRLATYYARLGLQGARAQHNEGSIGDCLISLGIIARSTGQLDSAAYFMEEAIQLFDRRKELNSAAFSWADLALIRNRQRKFAAAEQAGLQASQLAAQVQDTRTQFSAYGELGTAYAGQGKYRQAYETALQAATLNDSLNSMGNLESINALEVRFDTERRESRIQALTRQQTLEQQRLTTLALGLGAALLALAVAAALALRLRRSRALLAAQHAELTETRAAQDRLYALVAHDLRSPVVAFTGLADLLHRYVRLQDTARLASLGGLIRQAAQNLSELLDNLLNWAISQRGELVPAPRPLRVAELLAETAALYQATADAADIALTVTAPADLLVQADPNMTRTILRNLTGNALKATPAGGTVQLHATPTATGISLQVTDNGPGLPPALLTQMATPTAHLRVARHGHGTGLGLLLSRTFAEAQGGSLALGNATAGPGAVATLTLPQG